MSDVRGLQNNSLRIDTSRMSEYMYADKPKLSFGQKLTRGLGKAFSFLGPIGAAVTAIAIPGAGLPIAAGMYGLSKLAADKTAVAEGKDAQRLNDYNAEMSQMQMSVPGFLDGGMGEAMISPGFSAPSQFNSGLQQTLVNRESARFSNLSTF